ncbi:MAG: calcium/sodium antiporter [Aquificae bacterium]|nr:calcium/sodium antiporter [Aquificota bacterium]
MLKELGLFTAGLVLLVKGADLLIEGSSSVAKRFGIPDFVIGLTLVAFGTSLPEFTVNTAAALKGASDISLGNVVGSNVANILLILGLAALVRPITVNLTFVKKEIPVNFFLTLTVIAMANDALLDGAAASFISRTDGLVLMVTFVGYMYFLVAYLQREAPAAEELKELLPLPKALLFTLLGLTGLVLGADWTVDGAVGLAKAFGVSEALIGLFMVAVGTSLPELSASVVSAYRGHPDIALGNVAGSNIFNLTLVLGTSAVIRSVPVPERANVDLTVLFFATLLLLISSLAGRRRYTIDRLEGAFFVLTYFTYAVLSWLWELS